MGCLVFTPRCHNQQHKEIYENWSKKSRLNDKILFPQARYSYTSGDLCWDMKFGFMSKFKVWEFRFMPTELSPGRPVLVLSKTCCALYNCKGKERFQQQQIKPRYRHFIFWWDIFTSIATMDQKGDTTNLLKYFWQHAKASVDTFLLWDILIFLNYFHTKSEVYIFWPGPKMDERR